MALVAMLLLSAIAAGAASAAKFEAEPEFPVKFTGTGGTGLLETVGHHSVTCEKATASGTVATSGEAKEIFVHFKGCFAEHAAALKCTTAGSAEGEISTNSIKGTPVDLDAAHTEVGLLLEPSVSGGAFTKFTCKISALGIEEELEVTGSTIGRVKPTELNEFRSSLNLEFIQVGGTPLWSQVEGTGTRHVLVTSGKGTEPFAAQESAIGEAVPGSTETVASEGKKLKVIP